MAVVCQIVPIKNKRFFSEPTSLPKIHVATRYGFSDIHIGPIKKILIYLEYKLFKMIQSTRGLWVGQ